MKKQIALGGIATAIGGMAVGYALWGNNNFVSMQHRDNDTIPAGMHRMPDGSLMGTMNHDMGMMDSMDHSNMAVQSERAFIEGMIPHHQEAVDTAKEVIARGGTTPAIKKLAEDIVTAQEKEISMMKTWYVDWYGEAYATKPNSYIPMMRNLTSLSGVALDQVFLEDMIRHHQGALVMAQSVQPHIAHSEIADLTKAIVTTQTIEIEQMRRLLKELP